MTHSRDKMVVGQVDAALSFVLGYASKNDAQRFNQGLYYLQDKEEKFRRAGTTRDGRNFYFALRGTSSYFALTGSCVNIISGWVLAAGAARCKTYAATSRAKTSRQCRIC